LRDSSLAAGSFAIKGHEYPGTSNQEPASRKKQQAHVEGEMAKILIIGEKAESRTLLAEELAAEGHTVALTGTAALIGEFLFTLEPDLVLLDLCLNRVDQWWVLDEIKRQSPDIPLVPYTSSPCEEAEGAADRVTGYLKVLRGQVFEILREKYSRPYIRGRSAYLHANLNLALKGQA
jgi:CheY-like chemotaxis protein